MYSKIIPTYLINWLICHAQSDKKKCTGTFKECRRAVAAEWGAENPNTKMIGNISDLKGIAFSYVFIFIKSTTISSDYLI